MSNWRPTLTVKRADTPVIGSVSHVTSARRDDCTAQKLQLLSVINAERTDHGLRTLELDTLASYVGDLHCRELADRGYHSHLNTHGYAPYHRYAFAGGRDYVVENLSTQAIATQPSVPAKRAPEHITDLLLACHDQFMQQSSGEGTQRDNVLDQHHTHVGIGLALSRGGSMVMVEEYVNRYVELDPIPGALVMQSKSITVSGRVLKPGFGPFYLALFHESFPQPMTATMLQELHGYGLPQDQLSAVWPWQMKFDGVRQTFKINVELEDEPRPGFYFILLWVAELMRIPFDHEEDISTDIAVPAGMLVIRCEQRPAPTTLSPLRASKPTSSTHQDTEQLLLRQQHQQQIQHAQQRTRDLDDDGTFNLTARPASSLSGDVLAMTGRSAVSALAQHETRNDVRNMQGLDQLLTLLSSQASDVQANSVSALFNMALTTDNIAYIVRRGGIPLLVSLLKSRVAAVRKGAAGALLNCSAQSADVRTEIRHCRGLQPLLALMTTAVGGDGDDAAELAAGALRNCAQDPDNAFELNGLGATRICGSLLVAPYTELTDAALSILVDITHYDAAARLPVVSSAEGMRSLCMILSTGSDFLRQRGAMLVTNCADTDANRHALKEYEVIPPLVTLLNSGTDLTRAYACDGLYQLAYNDHCAIQMRISGAVRPLAALLTTNSDMLLRSVIQCLMNLLAHDDLSAKRLREYAAFAPLVRLLQHDSAGILRCVAGALYHSTKKEDANRTELVSCSGVAPLVRLLQATESTDTRIDCCGTLMNTSCSQVGRQQLLDANGISVIVPHLQDPDLDVAAAAAGALQAAALDEHCVQEIVECGGIVPLIHLLTRTQHTLCVQRATTALQHCCDVNDSAKRLVSESGGIQALAALISHPTAHIAAVTTLASCVEDERVAALVRSQELIPQLVDMSRDALVQVHGPALALLHKLCSFDTEQSVLQLLEISDGIRTVVARLKSATDSVLRATAGCLMHCALDVNGIITLREAGVLKLALPLVGSRNLTVSANALALLANMLGNDAKSREHFIQAAAVTVVAASLGSHKVLIQRNAAAVLANLALDGDGVRELIKQKVLHKVCTVAAAQSEDAAADALICLMNCAAQERACRQLPTDVLERAVRLLSNASGREAAAGVLANCAGDEVAGRMLHCVAAEPALCAALNEEDLLVQQRVAYALANLCRNPELVPYAIDSGAVQSVIPLLSSLSAATQISAALVLTNVCYNGVHRPLVRQYDGLRPLVEMLSSRDSAVQAAASLALTHCSDEEVDVLRAAAENDGTISSHLRTRQYGFSSHAAPMCIAPCLKAGFV